MNYKTKRIFVIPVGTLVTKKMLEWIKNNCNVVPKYDLPDGFDELFKGMKK